MLPKVVLSPLQRADGSANYSYNGYSILAAINGPVEVQRRDELPEEAAVDVIVRPATGIGGVKERHLESIIHRTLRQVIVVSAHPRKLIQITLQIIATPENDSTPGGTPQAASNLPVLPALLQASTLALLSTSIPLTMTLTSTLIAAESGRSLIQDPSPVQLRNAESIHVLAFSSSGHLLVAESEGLFDIDVWEKIATRGKNICISRAVDKSEDGEKSMSSTRIVGLDSFVKDVVGAKILAEQKWKDDLR